jgi:hypothetical protein
MIFRRWVTGTTSFVTLNLSGAKNHGCRSHLRSSVCRASGFVLTGFEEIAH